MTELQQFETIKKLIDEGLNDKEISLKTDIKRRRVGYIREKYKLNASHKRRNYQTKEDRIKGYMIRNIKYSAKRRNLEFDLDYTDITLPKYCPLLEIELNYTNQKTHKFLSLGDDYVDLGFNDPSKATVDRIDNNKGYVKGNIIILSRMANAMKNESSFEQLKTFNKNSKKLIEFFENQGARGNITDIFFNKEELNLDS